MAEYGTRIIKERYSFTEELSEISKKIHKDISGNTEELEIEYESDFKKDFSKEEYTDKLKKSFEGDLYRGYTSIGPHKDDLCIKVDGKDIKSYGSQGQQRTASLSLKLAEIGLIKQETGKNAVLLLDDVLSELDQSRQKYLIDTMSDVQVFITTTEIDDKLKRILPGGKLIVIDNANAYLYNN